MYGLIALSMYRSSTNDLNSFMGGGWIVSYAVSYMYEISVLHDSQRLMGDIVVNLL